MAGSDASGHRAYSPVRALSRRSRVAWHGACIRVLASAAVCRAARCGSEQPISGRRDTEDRTGRYGGNGGALEHERADSQSGEDPGTTGAPTGRQPASGKRHAERKHDADLASGDPGPKRARVAAAYGPSMNAVRQALEEGCGARAAANVLGEACGSNGFWSLLPTLLHPSTRLHGIRGRPVAPGQPRKPRTPFRRCRLLVLPVGGPATGVTPPTTLRVVARQYARPVTESITP